MGLRYGLLAVLTLIIASALVWDRLHPPETNRLFPRDEPAKEDLAVVVLGGKPEPLAPPAPLPPGALPADPAGGEPGAPVAGQGGTCTVEKGDTLGQIALRTLGTSRRAAELAKFNGMALDGPLKVGQELRIPPQAPAPAAPGPAGTAVAASSPPARDRATPPGQAPASSPGPAKPEGRTCKVSKGDTLFSLAKRYYGDGGKFRAIAEANRLDPEEPLKVGTEIRIP